MKTMLSTLFELFEYVYNCFHPLKRYFCLERILDVSITL